MFLLLCLSLLSLNCDGRSAFDDARPNRRAAPRAPGENPPSVAREKRGVSVPARSKVLFHELGGSDEEIRTAITDLKRIDVWHELTDHLHQIDVKVEPGRANVREDRHLADARFWRQPVGYGTFDYPLGVFCQIRFFPAAMKDDIYRWTSYYRQGLTGRTPPTMRQFWASIMGHELFHCPAQGSRTRPEPGALAWEARILDALQASRIE
jgi:hypothetical protein